MQGAEGVKADLDIQVLVNLDSPTECKYVLCKIGKLPHIPNAFQESQLAGGFDSLHLSSSSFPTGSHRGWLSRNKISQL